MDRQRTAVENAAGATGSPRRDRVRTALAHREPDRVPIDVGGTFVTGVHEGALGPLRQRLGLDAETSTADLKLGLGWVERDIRDHFDVDIGLVGAQGPHPDSWQLELREDDGYVMFTDEFGMGWRQPKGGGLYFDLYHHPLAGDITVEDVKAYPWPDPLDEHRFARMRADCERVVLEEGRASICRGMTAGTLETALWMRGFEQFFMDTVINVPVAAAILDRILEIKLTYWGRVFEEIGDILDVCNEPDDFGSQDDLLISPDSWRQLMKPRLTELCGFIHGHSDARVFLHSDGAIRPIIGEIIEAGVDILNPVQFTARGMELPGLKRDFGSELTFWGGGVDSQGILPRGTPEQVRAQVIENVETLKPGGGYVFASVHNIQADVPPENIVAMVEAFREVCDY